MFRGITELSMDSKGRVAVPVRYREALEQASKAAIVLTIDTEETCLLLYPAAQWQIIEDKLQSLPSFNAAARRIQRLLIGHATDIELDSNGRMVIPPVLQKYAQLDKKVVIIGQGNKFEIWNQAIWETKREVWLAEEASLADTLPEEMKGFSL